MSKGIWAEIGKGLVCLAILTCAGFGQTPTKEFIYLGGRLVAVENTGANVTVTPSTATIPAAGGSGTFTVSAAAGVSWSASVGANDTWLTATVSGNSVNFSAGANTAATERQGQITIGGAIVTVTQQGAGSVASGAIVVSTEIFLAPVAASTQVSYVEAPAGVAWTASVTSGSTWLSIVAGGSGPGPQYLQIGVAALGGGANRVGTVTVTSAGRPSKVITIYQWPGGPAPSNVDVTPSPVTEQSKAFTFSASNTAGGAYVAWIQVIIQQNADARDACYLQMNNTDNRVYLREDSGVNWVANGRIGEDVVLENTQCSVNLATATKVIDGNLVKFQIPIAGKQLFAGTQKIYQLSGSMENAVNAGGWELRGTWTPLAAPAAPNSLSVLPTGGAGPSQVFTFRMSSPGGARYLFSGYALINDTLSATNGCYLVFHRSTRKLAIVGVQEGTLETTGTITNGLCTIDLAASSIRENLNELTLTVAASFSSSFYGAKNTYSFAVDRSGQTAGWATVGTWTVQAGASPVSISSVTPTVTAGSATIYEVDMVAPSGGASSIDGTDIIIGAMATDSRDSCQIYVNPSTNQVKLATDGSYWDRQSMWGTVGTFGQTTVLENSQCRVYLANSSKVALNASALRLKLAIEFLPLFAWRKTIYVMAYSNGVPNLGGYQLMTTFPDVTAPVAPVAVTVPPITGSGMSGDFTFKLQSSQGPNFIHSGVAVLDVASTFNTNAATWCKVLYHVSSKRVVLPDGTANSPYGWIGYGAPPVGTNPPNPSITTGNCEVNLATSTLQVQTADNSLQAVFPLTFKTPFAGAKRVALVGLDKVGQFGTGLTTAGAKVGDWTVANAAPPPVISPLTAAIPAEGGPGSFGMTIATTGTNANWTISYAPTDVTVTDAGNGATGNGNRTFAYNVTGNSSTTARNVGITITGVGGTAIHTITQEGKPVCTVDPDAIFLGASQSKQFNAKIGGQLAGQLGYGVTWGLYRKDVNGQYVAADPTFGTLTSNGLYSAPAGGTPTAYARATCTKGTYSLAPAYGEIQVRTYYPEDCNYRVSLSDGNGVGRSVEMLFWQQSTPCGTARPVVEVLIASAGATSAAGQCLLTYFPGGGQMLALKEDGGVNWARPATWYPVRALINGTEQVTREGSGMTQNSQCLIDYSRAWEKFGNPPQPLMKWNVPFYFHPSFAGGKDIKLREQSLATPWSSVNAVSPWTVPNLTNDPPAGAVLSPAEGATVFRSSGVVFTGWALDSAARVETTVQKIKVYMDGEYMGLASYQQPSTICTTYPGRPGCPNVGFTFTMGANSMGVGEHLFEFVVQDSDTPWNLLKVLSRRVYVQ